MKCIYSKISFFCYFQACDQAKLLHTHVTGVMLHGKSTYMVLDCNQYPHDSNWTLNCLLYCLDREFGSTGFPQTLYIQLDNCARENKNRYFLGFMGYLVHKKIFKEVYMSFLVVGHTHEGLFALIIIEILMIMIIS